MESSTIEDIDPFKGLNLLNRFSVAAENDESTGDDSDGEDG